ncbi:MAG TPA: NAD(P)/FAD-dependent oxidoreductase [Rhodocyclaceae bacterium]|nr:NAD(P)/FAD-dependent oxidoreductase [Rhodocyclaceae bacterium]
MLVIGAAQAGLAAGYHLRRARIPFLIVDAARRVGDSWRSRYDGLTLFTPRQFSALPGIDLPGNREGYPDRDEFADYLESYAERFRLPVRLESRVDRLVTMDGGFEATLSNGEALRASEVILATGGFQCPIVPAMGRDFGPGVLQLTTETFRNPDQLPDGPVLVVGDGASGRDIAVETRKLRSLPVLLATGKRRKLLPERIFGKSIWWWLQLTGVLKAPADSFIGRKLKETDAFPDRERNNDALTKLGIRVLPRLVGAEPGRARFGDAGTTDIRTVIWAIGYRDDTSWLDIPAAKTADGEFAHRAGISPVPGLYYVGRPWQRNRTSALIMGAGEDADMIVKSIISTAQPKSSHVEDEADVEKP